eukprot:TRINITY_DN10988_c0_g1_i1.p1 TRINITY_DN10988_c0_g1~~TRINITY_DN10988_c0_g1_i1.p1  ORF type:complete len:414 (+),score=121.44 TRINITY_DN10988_c0_g1_i1:347-1588(+)
MSKIRIRSTQNNKKKNMGDKVFATIALTAVTAAAAGVLVYNMSSDTPDGSNSSTPKPNSFASGIFSRLSSSSPSNNRKPKGNHWKRYAISQKEANEFWLQIVSLNDFEIVGSGSEHEQDQDSLNSLPVFKRSKRAKEILRLWGIQPHLRPLVWPIISNLNEYKRSVGDDDIYKKFSQDITEGFDNKKEIEIVIEKDLERTFPEEEIFTQKRGIESLRRVLVAFSRFRSQIGYCQSLNFVAGAFLMSGLSEEQSFWMLDMMVSKMLPPNYYSSDMMGLRKDMAVFDLLCKDEIPKIFSHLEKHGVSVFHYGMSWFLCLFLTVMKKENAMRFMDIFLYEGSKAIFRVALGLLKLHEKKILAQDSLWEIVILLKGIPDSPDIVDFSDIFQPDWDLGEISQSRIEELRKRKDLNTDH